MRVGTLKSLPHVFLQVEHSGGHGVKKLDILGQAARDVALASPGYPDHCDHKFVLGSTKLTVLGSNVQQNRVVHGVLRHIACKGGPGHMLRQRVERLPISRLRRNWSSGARTRISLDDLSQITDRLHPLHRPAGGQDIIHLKHRQVLQPELLPLRVVQLPYFHGLLLCAAVRGVQQSKRSLFSREGQGRQFQNCIQRHGNLRDVRTLISCPVRNDHPQHGLVGNDHNRILGSFHLQDRTVHSGH
mmetsp:Transcript_38903/g.84881  ORF Transcript_38903/g.84881 Transcript_38903/m.84881 type:complete len:244 (-) Transcript_38903:884-1615(-)